MPAFFVASQQTLLNAVLNCLIPATDDFPGAGDLGVTSYVDTVVGRSVEMKRLFAEGLTHIALVSQALHGQDFIDLAEDQKDAVLRQVEALYPAFFEALVQHTYSGYYSHSTIIRLLGLEARPPQPHGYHLEPLDFTLLDNVKQRGSLYRQA